ncbi:helix-turn-helix domain-containing protein [Dysgonomonas reticulitermitis]
MSWIILSFLTTAITLILTYFTPSNFGITHLAEPHKGVADILTVLGFLVLLSLFVYYKNKIVEIELEIAQNANRRKPIRLTSTKENTTSRNENIYTDVLALFEQEKPYCNPNYSITDLAVKLNSNVKYVSLALRSQNSDNFNTFINSFRIRLVKEILNDDSKKKYTLQHIYISAGFRNQSTFNKAFRIVEGITPSEYIAQKKKTQTIL